jgi:hypothetical protein
MLSSSIVVLDFPARFHEFRYDHNSEFASVYASPVHGYSIIDARIRSGKKQGTWHDSLMERGKQRREKLLKRRGKAVALFEEGERQATVAHLLRVSKQSVSEWWLAWQNHDTQEPEGATRTGRLPRLNEA